MSTVREILEDFMQMPAGHLNAMIALSAVALAGFTIFAILSVVKGKGGK